MFITFNTLNELPKLNIPTQRKQIEAKSADDMDKHTLNSRQHGKTYMHTVW